MPSFQITELNKFLATATKNKKLKPALYLGDSWFQYPLRRFPDLQRLISNKFHDQIVGLDDSYPGRDADEVIGLIKRWRDIAADLKASGRPLQFILLSLGGNDVIGKDFSRHLHKSDQTPGVVDWPWAPTIPAAALKRFDFEALRETFSKIRGAYQAILELRDEFAPKAKVITHTYADVCPSDTPYKLAGIALSGPWIHEPLNEAQITDTDVQREISRWLLQSFHALLLDIGRNKEKFTVLDSRQELSDPKLWDNEIHPRGKGFRALAEDHWFPAIRG